MSDSYEFATHRSRVKGTPPRVWGLLVDLVTREFGPRYTPTRVGTSFRRFGPAGCRAVHPHACGDFGRPRSPRSGPSRYTPTRVGTSKSLSWFMSRANGTPPRVWGLRVVANQTSGTLRYTPTRVGTSSRLEWRRQLSPVHPHACGDFTFQCHSVSPLSGTPPRVWGLRGVRAQPAGLRRYTPTRVGTSASRPAGTLPFEVHPHACGDFLRYAFSRSVGAGTPPRVWGLPLVGISTPFHAGTPPRVWGLLVDGSLHALDGRYTPTRVGTSVRHANRLRNAPVHPHACGDFGNGCWWSCCIRGTPPRVWGLPRLGLDDAVFQRYTPTRVGTSRGSRTSR